MTLPGTRPGNAPRCAARYKGYDIVSMPPPSSGGVALIEMLNILEPFDLKSKGLLTAPALHLQIEAMRRAYLDRARHLGDPDFVEVPVSRLTSKDYARQVAASIDPGKASSSVELGKDIVTAPATAEPDETTHFSVIDRNGLAVTSTYTLEGGFGSHVVVKGAGFLLNNEMGDFNRKPGETNVTGDIGTTANQIAPGKTDAELDDADDGGQGWPAGAPDRLAWRADDHQHGLRDRPRRHGVRVERPSGRRPGAHASPVAARSRNVRRRCRARGCARDSCGAMGHEVRAQSRQGDAHSIWVAPDGTPYGVPDKRTPDSKASVPQGLTAPAAGR